MARYTLLILLSILVTPIQAQIEQCEILYLKDAIVISEYLPCPRHALDSFYVEGNLYICFDGKRVIIRGDANYNRSLIRRYGANVDIPECLKNSEEWDNLVDWFNYDGSYNLDFSKHLRREYKRVLSNDFYKRAGKKSIYVVYHFEGEIVMYKMKRKIILWKGFRDPIYTLKTVKSSKFAVLKKAERLRSLTEEEVKSMKLKKTDNNYINLFVPE